MHQKLNQKIILGTDSKSVVAIKLWQIWRKSFKDKSFIDYWVVEITDERIYCTAYIEGSGKEKFHFNIKVEDFLKVTGSTEKIELIQDVWLCSVCGDSFITNGNYSPYICWTCELKTSIATNELLKNINPQLASALISSPLTWQPSFQIYNIF